MDLSRRDLIRTVGATGALATAGVAFSGTATAGPSPSATARQDIPSAYLEEYRAAGEAYGIDWTYLAGIGKVESDHGRYNPSGGDCIYGPPTRYGRAKGPMQFIDSTWDSYGVDGDGDGVADACNFRDAIPAAANYLTAAGAPGDYREAVYAYNHSNEYVNDVFSWAQEYRGSSSGGDPSGTFGDGDRVKTTANLVIHTRPSLSARDVWTAPNGSAGYVRSGPRQADGFTWYKVGFNAGYEGWCVEAYLDGASLDGGNGDDGGNEGDGGDGGGGGSDGTFEDDQRVATTADLVIHTGPALSDPNEWVAPEGSAGYVRDGPKRVDDYTWWEVEFNAGPQGWCVEEYLTAESAGGGGGGDTSDGFVWPVSGEVTSNYYSDRSYGNHRAIDVAAPTGAALGAAADGTVTYTDYSSGAGYYMFVEHDDGYQSEYMHLSEYAASEGDRVSQGETIAYVGSTGHSTGPHLHYEFKQYDENLRIPIDVGDYVTKGDTYEF